MSIVKIAVCRDSIHNYCARLWDYGTREKKQLNWELDMSIKCRYMYRTKSTRQNRQF